MNSLLQLVHIFLAALRRPVSASAAAAEEPIGPPPLCPPQALALRVDRVARVRRSLAAGHYDDASLCASLTPTVLDRIRADVRDIPAIAGASDFCLICRAPIDADSYYAQDMGGPVHGDCVESQRFEQG